MRVLDDDLRNKMTLSCGNYAWYARHCCAIMELYALNLLQGTPAALDQARLNALIKTFLAHYFRRHADEN